MTTALKSPSLWLTAVVFVGIINMAIGAAPAHYLAVNAAALGLALAAMRLSPAIDDGQAPLAIAVGAVIVLFFPVLTGPEVDGVSRWIGLGPVQLHSGMLVLPVLAALLSRLKPAHRLTLVALAAIAVSIQPDRASAIALLAATGAAMLVKRSAVNAIQLLLAGLAGLAVLATFAQPDVLLPVRFVETVFSDAWQHHPAVAVILMAIIVATLTLPALGHRTRIPAAASVAGFAIAPLIGAYPVPLLGYGASAILGFGLAVAVARPTVQ